MKSLTGTMSFVGLFLLLIIPVMGQDTEENVSSEKKKIHFSFTFGTAAGNFANNASDFNAIYSNRDVSRIYFAGIGTNTFYLIGKYREYTALGASRVAKIDVLGKAEWKQKFYFAGIRISSTDSPIYVELLYVVTKAEEKITTINPVVQELTTGYETEHQGGGFAIGIAVDLIGPIGVFVEGEYTAMIKKQQNPSGKTDPDLGGICVSAGVHFAL